jgi:cysteine desulfurase/selenocysteine lyase
VIERMDAFLRVENANIHRGLYPLSEAATLAYDGARQTVAKWLNVSAGELVFTRGATEGVNLVAQSFLKPRLKAGGKIVLSVMEHHANIVPWQLVAEETGAELAVVPISESGELDLEAYGKLLDDGGVQMVALVHISNALGTINPIRDMVARARGAGVPILVDGSQTVAHLRPDLQEIDPDFFVFSGHKVFGPTGIGVLYGKRAHLEAMPPYQGGGDMIRTVSFDGTTYADPPERFEAGTPNIVGAIGLAAAFDFLAEADFEALQAHENRLYQLAAEGLRTLSGIRIIGEAAEKVPVLSFLHESLHPHDLATFLASRNVCVRAGHHCCMPLMDRLGIPGTARASLAFYNTEEDVKQFLDTLERTIAMAG